MAARIVSKATLLLGLLDIHKRSSLLTMTTPNDMSESDAALLDELAKRRSSKFTDFQLRQHSIAAIRRLSSELAQAKGNARSDGELIEAQRSLIETCRKGESEARAELAQAREKISKLKYELQDLQDLHEN